MSLQAPVLGRPENIKKKDIGTSAVTVYTVTTGASATLHNISLCNTTGGAQTVSLYITNSAVDYYILNALSIAANTTSFPGIGEITLVQGDVLKVIASATAFDVVANVTINHAQQA